ncbi:MAG: hypothetical protein ACKVT2_03155 [Saprospiraceae bacterium]
MNTSKFILSTIAYAVLITAVAVIYHDAIFGTYYYGFNIYSAGENFSIPIALIGSFIEGGVLSYCVQRFAPATNRVRFGIVMGVLLCLFASSYDVFQTAALENVQGAGRGSFIALESMAMLLYGVAGGAVVGWINRRA